MGKITRKLILYFLLLLLFFSVLMAILFTYQFSRQTTRIYRDELEKTTIVISSNLAGGIMDQFGAPMGKRGNPTGSGQGLRMLLRFLDQLAMGEVWIVDRDAHTISMGQNRLAISFAELPDSALQLLDRVFAGEVASTETFGSVLGHPTVTAGAPIHDSSGNVIGAVLLHRQIEDIYTALKPGLLVLLFSMLSALAVSGLLAVFMAERFNQPLMRMAYTAEQLARGNYQIATGVRQDDEIGLLAQNIDNLAGELHATEHERERLEQMRSDFISNVSHELRTPVTVIRGSVEALNDGIVTDPQKVSEYYDQILAESIQLERMVNDLLELTRLQNPDYKIERVEINLPAVVEDAVRSIRQVAQAKEISIKPDINASPVSFYGDYGRLRQMFIIVLDNAVKFSRRGDQVTVEAAPQGDSYKVVIRDHGKGIPQEDLPFLFSRFYKGKRNEEQKGSGLGLAIAREIADRHGVRIDIDSKEGSGTAFGFIFPGKPSVDGK
ncbi:MAG: HAMP domain-containing protein [Chloroflexi bacterium]|nr:HAMP domain-containing protein [Chloroflexota bacterium]